MAVSRWLLIFAVTSVCECSESAECEEFSVQPYYLLAGEAFYFVHRDLSEEDAELGLTWSRNTSSVELISSDEQERIHYHGHTLFFLNLRPEDSGTYTARLLESGECSDFSVTVEVLDASDRTNPKLLFGTSENFGSVMCPLHVQNTCDTFGGNYTWYKDYKLLPGLDEDEIRMEIDDEGVFTCICTWKYKDRTYNSSGARRLLYNKPSAHPAVQILSPLDSEQFAESGAEVTLKCTVFCGIAVERDCHVHWSVNGVPAEQKEGYNQTTQTVTDETTKETLTTTTLVIRRVSQEDFQKFKCSAEGEFTSDDAFLILRPKASILPFAIAAVCVWLFCVSAVVLVKCFAIELALCFRPYLPLCGHEKEKGVRLYDAYVVYHTHNLDKSTEDTLAQFVTHTLPSVLEEKHGYRLFIQGRDQLPGQDNAELVESSMEQSRRLMVILTPRSRSRSGSEVSDPSPALLTDSEIGDFDWQVGLHHVLLQMKMSVILIQLGHMGPQEYLRLPMGLQHLIRKSSPIRWPEGSRTAALHKLRFWNRVRYLMPAGADRTAARSAVV